MTQRAGVNIIRRNSQIAGDAELILAQGFLRYRRYEGTGIYRGEVLSAFYYIADSKISESGVFVVRKAGEMFKGVYAQYDLRSGMKPYQSPEDFILRRIQIPFWAQVKMFLRRPPFPRYEQVKKLYDEGRSQQPDTVVQI